ncbi:HEPN domain-containing protein [Verrucomicrobiota bacterium]
MNEVTREWINKAEGDFATALREYHARKNRNHDAVCFHAQQCVEKYLKGVLQSHNIPFGKTHDLVVLLKACLSHYPLWTAWIDDLKMVSRFAVQFRYPGESAIRDDAAQAIRAMKKCRGKIRKALGLRSKKS